MKSGLRTCDICGTRSARAQRSPCDLAPCWAVSPVRRLTAVDRICATVEQVLPRSAVLAAPVGGFDHNEVATRSAIGDTTGHAALCGGHSTSHPKLRAARP